MRNGHDKTVICKRVTALGDWCYGTMKVLFIKYRCDFRYKVCIPRYCEM